MDYVIHEDQYLLAYTRGKELFIRSWNNEREQYDYLRAYGVPYKNLSIMWRAVKQYIIDNPGCYGRSHKVSKAINHLADRLSSI